MLLWYDVFFDIQNFQESDRKIRKAIQIETQVDEEGHVDMLDG